MTNEERMSERQLYRGYGVDPDPEPDPATLRPVVERLAIVVAKGLDGRLDRAEARAALLEAGRVLARPDPAGA